MPSRSGSRSFRVPGAHRPQGWGEYASRSPARQAPGPPSTAPAPVRPHLSPSRNAPGRSATSAGPAPPAPPCAGTARSSGISPAAPGCLRQCPRWAWARAGVSGGRGRLRAETRASRSQGAGWSPRLELQQPKSSTTPHHSPEVLKPRHLPKPTNAARHQGAAIFPQVAKDAGRTQTEVARDKPEGPAGGSTPPRPAPREAPPRPADSSSRLNSESSQTFFLGPVRLRTLGPGKGPLDHCGAASCHEGAAHTCSKRDNDGFSH